MVTGSQILQYRYSYFASLHKNGQHFRDDENLALFNNNKLIAENMKSAFANSFKCHRNVLKTKQFAKSSFHEERRNFECIGFIYHTPDKNSNRMQFYYLKDSHVVATGRYRPIVETVKRSYMLRELDLVLVFIQCLNCTICKTSI